MELAVVRQGFLMKSHNEHSIRVTTPPVGCKPCFLPVYSLAIVSDLLYVVKIQATWLGELSDKCAAVVYVYYNIGIRNCTH